jgi:hypothetical protein
MKLPRLVHHSHVPLLGPVQSAPQFPIGQFHGFAAYGKPEGLWVATDGGWAEYCMSINKPLGEYHYEIKLAPEARILRISNPDDLDFFTLTYGGGSATSGYLPEPLPPDVMAAMEHAIINWMAVAERYQGIVIHPHIRTRHLHMGSFWYYSWDVGSGCIWDATAIAEVRQLAPKTEVSA